MKSKNGGPNSNKVESTVVIHFDWIGPIEQEAIYCVFFSRFACENSEQKKCMLLRPCARGNFNPLDLFEFYVMCDIYFFAIRSLFAKEIVYAELSSNFAL